MTQSQQDYLKVMLKLAGVDGAVSNKQIGQVLNVSAPAVTEMLQRMLREGYVKSLPHKGFALTTRGAKEAAELLRRHRLWEVFLQRHLGYDWSQVHQTAELLEHVTDPLLADRLDAFLEYPATCPHGGVIHTDYENLQDEAPSVAALAQGTLARIRRVLEDEALLSYLSEAALSPGDMVRVVFAGGDEDAIALEKEGRRIVLSQKEAACILADPVVGNEDAL